MRQWAAILGALLMFTLTGCAREEPGQRLTAVGIDTCTGVVTDYFTRGDGEAFADCIEVDTGDGGPLLFTLPEAGTPGVDAEVGIGDTIRLESDGGDEAYRLIRSLEVTEARSVLKEPPALTVSVGEKTRVEAGKGSSSWSYSDGRGGGCSIESCAASPLLWAEIPSLPLSPAELPHDTPLRVYLQFDRAPDSLEAAYWSGDCRGQSDAESVSLPALLDETSGCFYIELPDVNCIYEIHARWDEGPEGWGGTAWYAFRTELPAYNP